MTTVIRAVGATFTNPSLPSVIPFITDGLVAAYRPKDANGLVDLSGNGYNLTPIGNPTIKENGFVGDKNNGYNTGLLETVNLTYMAVYKVPPETVSIGGFIMGCFQPSPAAMGSSMYSLAGSGTTQPITAQTKATASNANIDTTVNAPAGVYTFVAMVVNAATNEVSIYIPKEDLLTKKSPTSGTIASRVLGSNNTVKLVAGTQTMEWLSKIELAEAAIYDKALTSEQIMQQYEKSKAYMQKKGIDI